MFFQRGHCCAQGLPQWNRWLVTFPLFSSIIHLVTQCVTILVEGEAKEVPSYKIIIVCVLVGILDRKSLGPVAEVCVFERDCGCHLLLVKTCPLTSPSLQKAPLTSSSTDSQAALKRHTVDRGDTNSITWSSIKAARCSVEFRSVKYVCKCTFN